MNYEGLVYRPPSEAYSLIIQVTVGCSHNQCRFCTMYKDDTFHPVETRQLFREMEWEADARPRVRRIFLADGDALCLSTERLVEILRKCRELWPGVERISSYATANDVLRKTDEELTLLKEEGLGLLYIGMESGSNDILQQMKKGHTMEDYLACGEKLKKAGIPISVTFISGLGGKTRWKEHAKETADLVSHLNPTYLSFLTLYLEPGAPLLEDVKNGTFQLLGPDETMKELHHFLTEYHGAGPTTFRVNHASNYAPLAGDLPKDKERLLREIEEVLGEGVYRDERWRRL